MFSTFKQRLLLGVFIFLTLSIPIGAYLVSQQQIVKSRASELDSKSAKPSASPSSKPSTSPTLSAAKELLSASEINLPSPSPSTNTPSETTIATSFGPTLSLKAKLEGRPEGNQASRIFVGILEGVLTSNPKFLLNFTIDLPADGIYTNLSLAGLNSGSNYTALLKGPSQIATSSGFIMSPTVTNLNSGETLNMLTGDLNDDNVINAADYSIAQKAFGATTVSSNWNENADLNKDGLINVIDLGIVSKNLGAVGASGAWTSPIAQGTSSASLKNAPNQGSPGYWIWVPQN